MMQPSGNLAGRLLRPFQEFAQAETSGGIVLLCCTVIALGWANSFWSASYSQLWETHFALSFASWKLDKSLHFWINDGLMAVFFFLVGLELKREVLVGELASFRHAVLPLVAAVGGVIFPAIIYAIFNAGGRGVAGWGIPMATDIAFALGVLALLGERIPLTLKIFLTAFAIFDDIIAVMMIAFFYSGGINLLALGLAGVVLVGLVAINLLGARALTVYIALGVVLWLLILQSGIHATIAGVLLAMVIPARARIDAQDFLDEGYALLGEFERADAPGIGLYMNDDQQSAVQALEVAAERLQTPLQRLEHMLHNPVSFVVVPLFVLANAGVYLRGGALLDNLFSPVSLGVFFGLVVGKQLGITLFSWLAVVLRWTELPRDVSWLHIYGVSWLGGIGFTMSLFIDGLAFEQTSQEMLDQAKVGILLAALIAGSVGYVILRHACRVGQEAVVEAG